MPFEPPDRLIDPRTGQVLLRLVPFHLERLHGPYPAMAAADDAAKAAGLPIPFLPGARSIDIVLCGGLTPRQIGEAGAFERSGSQGNLSWWRWCSHALTPFGWASSVSPLFEIERAWLGLVQHERLSRLKFNRHGDDPDENFEAMDRWLARELGAARQSRDEVDTWTRVEPRPSLLDSRRYRQWQFPWGEVVLYLEGRDGRAELQLEWTKTGA